MIKAVMCVERNLPWRAVSRKRNGAYENLPPRNGSPFQFWFAEGVSRKRSAGQQKHIMVSMDKKETRSTTNLAIYTIGHSTRASDEFIKLLKHNQIEVLVDVRKFPGSRKYPHFNQAELARSLRAAGMTYVHVEELGGRRPQQKESINTLWQNKSFQAYADYMATAGFRQGIEVLLEYARDQRTAIMCSEAVWWRCHRALIADYLKSTGIEVYHIMSMTSTQPHPFTSAARIRDGKLFYYE